MRKLKWLLIACVLGFVAVPSVWADVIIDDVPAYLWYHGCGPTAGGMILGYWDAHGFDDLIPGSNDWDTNRQAIRDVIASPGHIADFALYDSVDDSEYAEPYPDLSEHGTGVFPHRSDCLADFMHSSQSSWDMKYGWSGWNEQGRGLADYAEFCGYDSEMNQLPFAGDLWDELVASIDAARPVELLVDSDGNGTTDHFVTMIGYDNTPGAPRYRAYNTYSLTADWYDYAEMEDGQSYGVYGGVFFHPIPEPCATAVLIAGAMVALLRRRHAMGA